MRESFPFAVNGFVPVADRPTDKPYQKLGNRVSLLPITAFCAGAGKLSAQHGAGRAAAMGSAGHAHMAKQRNAGELLARLTPQEKETVLSWQVPTTVQYAPGVELDYESAEKELELGLDEYGYHCEATDERCICIGHLDFAWVRDVGDIRVAFIGDIKKSSYAVADGPESLQLHAYAHAYASKHGCQAYCTGLWIAEAGEWMWSKDMVVMGSERQVDIWEKLYHAIQNTGDEYSFGAHCSGCFSRLACPEYAMPLVNAEGWLSAAVDLDALLPSQAGDLLLKLQAFEKMADKLKGEIQERVKRGALTAVADGKRYAAVESKGRESVDVAALKIALGPRMEQYMKKGQAFTQFRWIKK